MKQFLLPILFLSISIITFGQGLNNNYKVDSKDLVNIFDQQGIHVFKFPFRVKKGEYIELSYEVYEQGEKIMSREIIKDFQKENGVKFNHHLSRRYKTRSFHRLYFIEEGDSLIIREDFPGVTLRQKINVSKVEHLGFNSAKIRKNVSKKREIMWIHGLYENSDIHKSTKGMLRCSTGFTKDKIIESYDFVILFFAERISAENAKVF